MKTQKKIFFIISFLAFSVSAQSLKFKDRNFEQAILNHKPTVDLNGDGNIQTQEAQEVKILDLRSQNLVNVGDLMLFPNIEQITLYDNQIEQIEIIGLKKLKSFNCTKNKLTKLIMKDLPELEKIVCAINQLTEVTLEDIPNLKSISFMQNKLAAIDLSHFPKLTFVNLQENQLTSINFNGNPELTQFIIDGNNLDSVNITKNPKLKMNILYYDKNVQLVGTENQLKGHKKTPDLIEIIKE